MLSHDVTSKRADVKPDVVSGQSALVVTAMLVRLGMSIAALSVTTQPPFLAVTGMTSPGVLSATDRVRGVVHVKVCSKPSVVVYE